MYFQELEDRISKLEKSVEIHTKLLKDAMRAMTEMDRALKKQAKSSGEIIEKVRCSSLEVVDRDGNPRLMASADEEGCCLHLLDEYRKTRMTLSVTDGRAGIAWMDELERLRARISTSSDGHGVTHAGGQACLQLFDRKGKTRIHAGTWSNGRAELKLFDDAERPRVEAGSLPDGTAGIRCLDKRGVSRIGAATIGEQATIDCADPLGRSRIRAITLADQRAGIQWRGADGKVYIRAGTKPDGTAIYPYPKTLRPGADQLNDDDA